jgi:16S rRNA G966 N2-methylase RsmD
MADDAVMTPELAEEFTEALGEVVAGGWRQVALGRRLGVPQALGISTAEWVERRLGGYVNMKIGERREAAAELTEEGMSNVAIGEVLGVNEITVRRDRASTNVEQEAAEPSSDKDADKADSTNVEPDPKQQAAADTRTRRDVSRSASVLPDAMELREGDCREVLADVGESSVNLVLTDPPYGDDAEPLYEWLAEWSACVLVPGGSLVCYTGQSRLNRDVAIFDAHLRYWWLLTMRHDRAQRIPGKFVTAEFKPVLWYVKKRRRGRTLINDVISSERDRSAHPWAQGSGGVAFLIENLTEPGERIVDPFAGTGTWGEIAAHMGRRWLGCDTTAGGATEVVS